MLRALRKLSLGEHTFEAGEVIPLEIRDSLPPRRVDVLIDQRLLEERGDEQLEVKLIELGGRIERLERGLNAQPKRARKVKVA